MRQVKTLGRLAMRAYKNPCDGSMINEFGIGHPYCYYLQFAIVLNKDINEKCDCDMKNTCKSAQGKCINVPIGRHHLLCDRPLCDICIFIRKYYLCYKLISEEELLYFEAHLKTITKLFHEYKIQLYLKNVQKYAYCFHSEEFQNHCPVMAFPPHFFLMYEFDDAQNLTNKEIEEI